MAGQFTSLQVLQGASMVGHDVLLEGNTLARNAGVASGAIDLAGRADTVKVDILSPGVRYWTLQFGLAGRRSARF